MHPDRREFLGRLATGSALAAGLNFVPGLDADLAAMVQPPADEFDLTWFDRVKGTHRAVFDCTEIESGAGVLRAVLWKSQYAQFLKVAPDDMTAVVVIRHSAIPLAMKQEYWDRYHVGKKNKVKHPFTDKDTDRNPAMLTVDHGDLPAPMGGLNIDGVLKSGGIVLACNLAFGDLVSTVAKEEKLAPAAARTQALTMLHPGILLQPSGVFGTLRAQEARCAYIKAS